MGHAVRGQDASGLQFGDSVQSNPVDLAGDLTKLMAAGVPVFVVRGDVVDRGIGVEELIEGVELIGREDLPGLCDAHDLVWHW